ncbi:MAG TPA: nitrate reductase associated protein [bacterium]|nr:nitrate reductase associated protein [bacterium]
MKPIDDELTCYFGFEEDMHDACLPMAVRYKLDTAGIKLHLKEWAGLPKKEQDALLAWPCATKIRPAFQEFGLA